MPGRGSLGEAVLDLTTDNRQADRGIDETKKKAEGLEQQFQRVGASLTKAGKQMTAFVTVPLAAAGAAAFKLAADAEEASNKFEVVMGGAADSVRERLKALEETVPLTTGEFLGLAAGIQDLLVPLGLARDAGADMSATFVEMAGDIAAFNDVSPKQVLDDIRSGLVGSSEPLLKYGVDTRVAALETLALTAGLIREGQALDDVTRAQAVLLAVQEGTTDSVGTAAREVESASAQTRLFARDIRLLGEEIGATLLPIFTPIIQGLREWVAWFRELSPATQEALVKAGLFVAAVGPLLVIIGPIVSGLGGLVAVLGSAGATVGVAGGAAAATTSVAGLSVALQVGLVAAVAAAGAAVGTFVNRHLSELRITVADTLDSFGFYGESIEEINASLVEAQRIHRETGGAVDTVKRKVETMAEFMRRTAGDVQLVDEQVIPLTADLKLAAAAMVDNEQLLANQRLRWRQWHEAIIGFNPEFQEVAPEVDKIDVAIADAAPPLRRFFQEFETGIPFIDGVLNSLTGLMDQGLSKLLGFFGVGGGGGGDGEGFSFSNLLGGLLGGATGEGRVGQVLSTILGTALGPIGGLVSGLISKGIGAIGGFFKNLFGGADAVEKEGRSVAGQFRQGLVSGLTDSQIMEAAELIAQGNEELWAKSVVVVKDNYLAAGRSIDEALAIHERLWRAEKEGGDAVNKVIAEMQAVFDGVKDKMTETGLSFDELRQRGIDALNGIAEQADVLPETMGAAAEESRRRIEDEFGAIDIPGLLDLPRGLGEGGAFRFTASGIESFHDGGIVSRTGLAMLERGELIIPAPGAGRDDAGGTMADVRAEIKELRRELRRVIPMVAKNAARVGASTTPIRRR